MSKVSSSPSSAVDPSSVDPQNAKAWEEAKDQAKDAGIQWERPADDKRSAQTILDESPLLKNLGNQSGVRESLEKRVGGKIGEDADATFRADPGPDHRHLHHHSVSGRDRFAAGVGEPGAGSAGR